MHRVPSLEKKAALSKDRAAATVTAAKQVFANGEDLIPSAFGGGFCRSGRTVPRTSSASLVSLAGLGRLQEVKSRIDRLGEDVNGKGANGETALAAAAAAGDTDMCAYLVGSGAEVLTTGSGGVTALHVAAREGHADIIRLLSNTEDFYRPDLDIKTKGMSPHACRR
jgi:ankyrin repeat protein